MQTDGQRMESTGRQDEKGTNMETNPSSVVSQSHPDLVIHVKEVTFGEENRKKMDSKKRKREKTSIAVAACALLNSGGGVLEIQMANNSDRPVEMGLDLEESLRDLIQSSDLQAFFETQQRGNKFYIFVKSWSCSPEDSPAKPRICSQNSSLCRRSGTSVVTITSTEAFTFLKGKKSTKCSLSDEGAMPQNSLESNPAFEIFQSKKLEYGQTLLFPESESIEFKQFSTKNAQDYIKNTIPEYVCAFANSYGGYLFIGVDDKSKKVLGCPKDNVDRSSLETVANEAISKLPVFHFSSCKEEVSHETRVIDVFHKGNLHGYLCVIKVEPFCCAVFSKPPTSWMVDKKKGIYSLTTNQWVDMMVDAGPEAASSQPSGLRNLCEDFECQLSLSNSPPCCRPVYSKKGLEHKADLQKHLFPVSPGCLTYTPGSLWGELEKNKKLKDLISQQMHSVHCGLLILSRSWAVDLDLEEKQGVICDALLIAEQSSPILYTILEQQDEGGQDYCTRTAFALKQKLVNTGGYTGRVCVMTKVLCLSSKSNGDTSGESAPSIDYPPSYNLANTQEMETLLQALVIVLLNFRSFLSDQLGCEVLNLLTAQQYEIFSKNLRKHKKLFVHGLPGSGKTIMAMKIMEKIRNTFHCEANRILYICENQRLRDLIRAKNICQAVTRKAFMKGEFETIQHIIVDEAQNFYAKDGDWYKKARLITQKKKTHHGIFWIFLDYFQTTHTHKSGLPRFSSQYPKDELTRVVRNADKIAEFLQEELQIIRNKPSRKISAGALEILNELTWASGVSGSCKLRYLSLKEMVSYVAEECNNFLRNGYSPHEIAVLFSTEKEKDTYKDKFLSGMRKRRVSQVDDTFVYSTDMFDSIRRFSGLERSIVFGIDPHAGEQSISRNLLLCLASRARKHLYILRFSDESTHQCNSVA
ncbi:schlafen family member 11 isoform X1 [Mesocricetus auratus]|uniref:Schlafen family member 11 isoform X1 n=2 Tax=Mesocricetus auratus TaxID=10036 RepID=A0ABM2XRA3_MESAU|nr:schlafen family member 11 isoform X1 [Mesocricetus auratus]XP_040605239.1 schlafen family member 11 isoform X1 [Mesocricetus auratus]